MVRLSDKATKATPVDADSITILDSEDTVSGTHKVKRLTFSALATWLLARFLSWFGVILATEQGMVADLAECTASITSGEATATFSGLTITTAHVGKTVVIRNAGGASTPLVTTVLARLSPSSATLAANASATVSGEACSVGTDNRTTLAAACATAAGKLLFVPPGAYLVTVALANTAKDGVAATVTTGTTVAGVPFLSRLHFLGSVNTATGANYFAHLFGARDQEDVRFVGLKFTSDNAGSFTYVQNNQAAFIDLGSGATNATDAAIVGCAFEDAWGFPAHDRSGSGERTYFLFNRVVNCANGVNLNGDYTIQIGNFFYNSEGFESSGKFGVYALNVFRSMRGVALSCGGNGGALARYSGQFVVGNVIDGSTGNGIVLADALVNAVVALNVISGTDASGITATATGSNYCERYILALNVVTKTNATGNPAVIGVAISVTGKSLLLGNLVYDNGDSGYAMQTALQLASANNVLVGNYLGGTNYDLSLTSAATGCYLAANYLASNRAQILAALGTSAIVASATTDVLETSRVSGDSIAGNFDRYRRYADGKQEWGPGGNTRDTNLYRTAADQLKTDDRLIATLGVVTNAGTTAARPAAPSTGQMYVDSTIGKPIWYDGANWIDATGATV